MKHAAPPAIIPERLTPRSARASSAKPTVTVAANNHRLREVAQPYAINPFSIQNLVVGMSCDNSVLAILYFASGSAVPLPIGLVLWIRPVIWRSTSYDCRLHFCTLGKILFWCGAGRFATLSVAVALMRGGNQRNRTRISDLHNQSWS